MHFINCNRVWCRYVSGAISVPSSPEFCQQSSRDESQQPSASHAELGKKKVRLMQYIYVYIYAISPVMGYIWTTTYQEEMEQQYLGHNTHDRQFFVCNPAQGMWNSSPVQSRLLLHPTRDTIRGRGQSQQTFKQRLICIDLLSLN